MKGKKKKEILHEPDDDCDDNDVDVNTPKSGVGNEGDDDDDDDDDDDESTNKVDGDNDESTEVEEQVKVRSNELNSILEDTMNLDGPFWANGTIRSKTELYMLSVITTYNNIDVLHGLRSTPQYGFNRVRV